MKNKIIRKYLNNAQTIFKLVFLLYILLHLSCDNNEEITPSETIIPLGNKIAIDGIISEDEWNDAQKLEIIMSDRENVEVRLKHDGESLLFLFELHNPNVSNVVFPEILIDVNNDKSSSWNTDDWWFHISGSDCESKGEYEGGYSNCKVEQPDWYAVPNYPTDVAGMVNTIEVSIPFTKLGISETSLVGMCILVTNLSNLWKYWPDNSNKISPSSWCNAKLEIN